MPDTIPADAATDQGWPDVAAPAVPTLTDTSIELFRSFTGTSDAAFTLIGTVAETAPDANGGTFAFPDEDVLPQILYIYKARRRDDATGAVSAFSPLIYARAPWPATGDTPMGPTIPPPTGLQTKLGIGLQDPGLPDDAPVQAARLLKVKSHGLDMDFTDPDVDILADVDSSIEEVPNTSKTGGPIKLTVSPEGIIELLIARFGLPTSVPTPAHVSTGPGDPAIGAYWDHTFKSTTAPGRPVTLLAKKGPAFIAFPGSVVNSLDVSADKTMNTSVEIDADIMALNKLVYDTEAALGLDVAGFDPLLSFGSSQILCYIGDLTTVSAEAKTFSLKSNADLGEEHTLNGKRGPSSHYKGMADNSGSLGLYFKTRKNMNIFMGVLAEQARPYGASKKKLVVPIRLLLQSELNAANFRNEVEFTLPKCSYKKYGAPVESKDAIMQAIDYKGFFDLASGTSLSVRVRNQISPTQLAQIGTALTSVPLNDVTSYISP